MNWQVWLALAGVVVMLVVPTPARARVGALAADGRLAELPDRPVRHRVTTERVAASAGFVAVVGVGVARGPLLALACAVVGCVGALLVRDARRGRAAGRHRDELRAALGVLVGELEAGALPATALSAAAGTGGWCTADLLDAADSARRAADPGGVLIATGDATLRAVGVAWQVGEATGAPLAAVLGRVTSDLEADVEHHRSLTAALAGPRSSAVVLSGLPLVGIALGTAMGASPVRLLTGTTAGQALCCAGVLLDACGVLWVRLVLTRAAQG